MSGYKAWIAVRHTIDVDVYRAVSQQQAEKDLRAALLLECGDWFTFDPVLGRRATGVWNPETRRWER